MMWHHARVGLAGHDKALIGESTQQSMSWFAIHHSTDAFCVCASNSQSKGEFSPKYLQIAS